jgi:hypothetical protein
MDLGIQKERQKTARGVVRRHRGFGSIPAPLAALGLAYNSPSYRVLLKWHLGIPLVPVILEGATWSLSCGTPVDTFGDHMVCCKRNNLWERQLGIQPFLSWCLQSSAIHHCREQSAAGDLKRDAYILIPSWEAGKARQLIWAWYISIHPGLITPPRAPGPKSLATAACGRK